MPEYSSMWMKFRERRATKFIEPKNQQNLAHIDLRPMQDNILNLDFLESSRRELGWTIDR